MSFKKKDFIKIFFFLLLVSPSVCFADEQDIARIFKDLTCVKDVKRLYPSFLEGDLNLDQQDRFFNCLWGFLDAVVNKKIVTHTPKRDHFTREEIFKMFHILFKYEEEESRQHTQKLLFFKKLFIGGSINTIKDEELSDLLNLVFDYKEAYYIIRKEIPVFKTLFKGKRVNPKRIDKSLEQLRKFTLLLSQAYQRENVTYTIKDLSQYPNYMGQEDLRWHSFFSLLQNIFEGALFPKKEIEGENWSLVVNVIRRGFDFLFYHNEYLLKNLSEIQFVYYSLSALEKFLPVLSSNEILFLEQGFPLKNFDKILKASLDFLPSQPHSSFVSHFRDGKQLRFLTRTLFHLSLNTSDQKSEISDWNNGKSLVSFSFPDSQFHFFEDHFTEKTLAVDGFISPQKIQKIESWIKEYKKGLLAIDRGFEEELAKEKGVNHWLDLFFGWNKEKQMIYGSFEPSNNRSKMVHLLSYQAFLSLILNSYVPEDYFNSDEQELSLKQWQLILSDLIPFLSVSLGTEGLQSSWKASLEDLFSIADLFLNSSDTNEKLHRKELMDLVIHLSSAFFQSQQTFQKLSKLCKTSEFSNCVVKAFLNRPEMLASYPRFKDYIFSIKQKDYEKHIQGVLFGLDREKSGFQILELFFLIQIMEVNYYQRIDTNFSFNLEFEELVVFAESFKEQIAFSIPYLYSTDQALAYILYNFQIKRNSFLYRD